MIAFKHEIKSVIKFNRNICTMIIDLNLKKKQVLIVGGGNESARKVEALLSQQCKITVVAEKVDNNIKQYADIGKIELEIRKIKNASFITKYKQITLILATTNDRKLNREIVKFGKALRCYVYAADDPEISDFSHPSVINIEDTIQVALSTAGKSPLMGKILREKVEPIIKDAFSILIVNQFKIQTVFRVKARQILSQVEDRKKFLIELMNNDEVNHLLEKNLINEASITASKLLDEFSFKVTKN